ncbi:hypothetical protein E2C01_042628 [Portunus trituberculatus]|uniref:Uncharacterized protein n=1 Tax=Portunus trituberculatus TaxID=210409 RepID=A0A5B7FV62_PORTR|nr:hypothetical protein [Portunus trituberculatus]
MEGGEQDNATEGAARDPHALASVTASIPESIEAHKTSFPGRVSATATYIDPVTPHRVYAYAGTTAFIPCVVNNLGQRSCCFFYSPFLISPSTPFYLGTSFSHSSFSLLHSLVPFLHSPPLPLPSYPNYLHSLFLSSYPPTLTQSTTSSHSTSQITSHSYLHTELYTIPESRLSSLRQVSWVRHHDIHVLTVGRFTFTNDDRFEVHHDDGSNEWLLRLR